MKVFMENTEVTDARTASEIQALLAEKGATSIQVDYLNGRVEGLSFCFTVDGRSVPFRLPCRWHGIVKMFTRIGKRVKKNDSYENWGRRVAWRQILRWVQAQLALIETEMVRTEEVFLPYAILPSQKTIYEMFAETKFLLPDKTSEGDGQA